MTDRELLELAAKAAGMTIVYDPYASPSGEDDWFITDEGYGWNPLADDGDALRLAGKLRMCIDIADDEHEVRASAPTGHHWTEIVSDHPTIEVATRRAIVRAAAEIGRRMQHE